MSTTTPKYQLIKHEAADPIRAADFNTNWDKIDTALDSSQQVISAIPSSAYQAVNSTTGTRTFDLDAYGFYLLIITGVNSSIGYIGAISTDAANSYLTEFAKSTVTASVSGFKLTINSGDLYVRVNLIKLKTT